MHAQGFTSHAIAFFLLGRVLDVHSAAVRRAFDNPVDGILAALRSIPITAAGDLPDVFSYHGKYSIPQQDPLDLLRDPTILLKQAAFLYGPPVAGGPYFPTGVGGLAKVAIDTVELTGESGSDLTFTGLDAAKLALQLPNYDGLKTVDDYTKLYPNNLQNSMPRGPDKGGLSNFTQDLYFSMERLANSPYQLKRLNPNSDTLSFQVDDSTAKKVSGNTLDTLFQAGRLFYADYRDQGKFEKSAQYGAACDAYFYIDPTSGDLLPMAIRTLQSPREISDINRSRQIASEDAI